MSELRTHELPRGQVTDAGKDLFVVTGAVRDRANRNTAAPVTRSPRYEITSLLA